MTGDTNPTLNNNDNIDSTLDSPNTNVNAANSGYRDTNIYQDRQKVDNSYLGRQGYRNSPVANALGQINTRGNGHNPYYGTIGDNTFGNGQNLHLLENQLRRKLTQGDATDDDVKLASQKFPQLQNLLDRLKELNRQKDLKKQQQGLNPQNVHHHHTTAPTTNGTPPIVDENPETTTTKKPQKHHSKKFKMLKRKKFYFQVRPVRPENEKKKSEEEVYYDY